MPSSRAFELADPARVFERAALVEPVGHRERLAVIGDGDVREAGGPGGERHGFGVGAAVGGGRVHVQIAAQVGERQQAWQCAALGGLDLAAVLAQLGRNVREAERPVDLFLRCARDELSVVVPVEAVFVELEAPLDGAIAQARCCAASNP